MIDTASPGVTVADLGVVNVEVLPPMIDGARDIFDAITTAASLELECNIASMLVDAAAMSVFVWTPVEDVIDDIPFSHPPTLHPTSFDRY